MEILSIWGENRPLNEILCQNDPQKDLVSSIRLVWGIKRENWLIDWSDRLKDVTKKNINKNDSKAFISHISRATP